MNISKTVGIFVLIILVMLAGCSSTGNTGGELKSSEFDTVLISGDGYNIVHKRVDNYDGAYDMVGVVDDNGNWIHQLSKKHIFIDGSDLRSFAYMTSGSGKTTAEERERLRISGTKKSLFYCDEGMFMLTSPGSLGSQMGAVTTSQSEAYIYNANDNIGFYLEPSYALNLKFSGGYIVVRDNRRVKKVSSSGKTTELNVPNDGLVGAYSDGLFFAKDSFYDINGKKVINLSEHNWGFVSAPYFKYGKSRIEFRNNAKTTYYTEIDKSGNVLYEPKKK